MAWRMCCSSLNEKGKKHLDTPGGGEGISLPWYTPNGEVSETTIQRRVNGLQARVDVDRR